MDASSGAGALPSRLRGNATLIPTAIIAECHDGAPERFPGALIFFRRGRGGDPPRSSVGGQSERLAAEKQQHFVLFAGEQRKIVRAFTISAPLPAHGRRRGGPTSGRRPIAR